MEHIKYCRNINTENTQNKEYAVLDEITEKVKVPENNNNQQPQQQQPPLPSKPPARGGGSQKSLLPPF